MIEVVGLSKNYGTRNVVDNLSFHVKTGDVLGFIGPNGAGKSTAMKMLAGILPVYSGTVRIGSYDVEKSPREARSMLGFLPENAPLYSNMSVLAFLRYAACMRGIMGRKLRDEKIAKAVERCALQDVLHEEIDALSKGYRRRVCLAQAILHEPPALIMDEPTDGLDPNQKREIRSLIGELRSGTAIILSTHILEEVEAVCSRVLLLCAGKRIFEGSREDFLAQKQEGEDVSALFARLTKDGGRT
ncbi:MAG: ATP-binding cassette domain-containing protein [Lentisphaeria bacterium]|nr:ATP-binding cassette domain-containing protein [Lentisphaeria bacterium]